MSSKPTIPELNKCLKVLVKWQQFALYLPGINQTDISIIEKDRRDDVVEQKIAVYDKWLQVYPNASWDHVIDALETAEENTIARQLREKYLTKETCIKQEPISSTSVKVVCPSDPLPGPLVLSSNQITATREVTVKEEIVAELNTLHQSFKKLAHDVESEVKHKVGKGDIAVKTIASSLKWEQAFPIPSLQSVTTSDKLFDAIRPHSNFLNCYLIVSIALSFLSRAIAEKANKYKETVVKFMKTTKIHDLQTTLKQYSKMFPEPSSTRRVEIVVENGWEVQSLWLVGRLVGALFPVKHPDELPWYDIVPGSVVMTFIALEHMTPSLIESSRKKTEFMRLIGVISLKIGDELVWKKEGSKNSFSFEDGLVQASLANNIEAVQFLLQYTQVNVNTHNTNCALPLNTIEVHLTETIVKDCLKSYHTTFVSIIKEITLVQQLKTNMEIAQIIPNGDGQYHDNFLNGRMLSQYELPEPLLNRINRYREMIDGYKRLMRVSYLQYPLKMLYFPTPFPDSIEVILTLHSVWRACSVWYVEQLGQLIFTPTLFHKLQWFRVDTRKESLRVVLLADKKLMDSSLTKQCLVDDQPTLTSLLGIISVQVDDIVVSINDCDGYTFNDAVELAKAMENEKVSSLLLQVCLEPVEQDGMTSSDENNNRHFFLAPDSTPLMIACCNNNSQLVQLLLDHNADPNVQNGKGVTALMYGTGNNKIFRKLLDHGADINKVTLFNLTMLHFASLAGNTKVVKLLLAKNCQLLNATDSSGTTPLKLASAYGHAAVVNKLLAARADPDIQDIEGWTALMTASKFGYTDIVQLLLQVKADPNIQNNLGWTSLEAATRYGHTAIVKELIQANANVNIQDNDGWTALMVANAHGNDEVFDLLLENGADLNLNPDNQLAV